MAIGNRKQAIHAIYTQSVERERENATHGYRNIGNILYVIGIQNLNFNNNPLYAITVTPNCHKFLSYNQKYAQQYNAMQERKWEPK